MIDVSGMAPSEILKLGVYTFTDQEIELDEEHEHLRPWIEQLNTVGEIHYDEKTDNISWLDRNFLRDYYPYFYYEKYEGNGKWKGYLSEFKTKEEREREAIEAEEKKRQEEEKRKQDEIIQKRMDRGHKVIDVLYRIYVVIEVCCK